MATILILLSLTATAQEGPTAEQFVRLMHGLTSRFKDVTCPFESEVRFVGPARLTTEDPDRLGTMLQGTFAYRSDGAALLDYYVRLLSGESPLTHRAVTVLRGEMLQLDVVPDMKTATPKRGKSTSLASLHAPGMPLVVASFWFFQGLEDATPYQYRFLGWETVQGRRCLVVQMNAVPIDRDTVPSFKYFIDVERDGHPIVVERYQGENLWSRTTVTLARVELPEGKSAWFPSGGTTEAFRWNQDYYREPIFREAYLLMLESAEFNQGLPDSAFTLKNSPLLVKTPELEALRREFATTPPAPRPSADPAAVQADLDAAWRRAEQNASELDASRSAAVARDGTRALPLALLVGGILVLIGLAGWRWRIRRP